MELFVSDLDGTLLNSEQQVSACSIQVINELIAEGMQFSIATARGIESTAKIIAPLKLTLPIIVSNGSFVYHPLQKRYIMENLLQSADTGFMVEFLEKHLASFFLFTVTENGERRIYYKEPMNIEATEYLNERITESDPRLRRVESFQTCLAERAVKIVAMGKEEELRPLYEILKVNQQINFDLTEDIYTKAFWLEIAHVNANKREALKFLQNYVKAERLICFGDNLNDCPMFEIADVKLAMGNAHTTLKKMASKIIGSNNENGVAEYLHKWHNQAKLNVACTISK